MKLNIIFPLLLLFELFTTLSNAQWMVIDTLFSFNQCTAPFPYHVTPVFVSNYSAYYFFNFPNCSPSTNSGFRVYRTSDSFSNWNSLIDYQSSGGGNKIYDLVFVNDNVGFLSCLRSGVPSFSKTIDAGATWNSISVSSNYPLVADLFFTSEDSGFAVSNDGILYRYFNDTIHVIDTINFTPCLNPKMFFTENNFGYVLAEDLSFNGYHKVLRSVDGGVNWSISLTDSSRNFYDISFYSDSLGYLASDTGLYITTDAGTNWTLMNTAFSNCTSISIVDSNVIFVIGSGSVYKTMDAGINWSQQIIPANCNPIFLKMIDDTVGFIYARASTFNYKNFVLKTINVGEVDSTQIGNDDLIIESNPTLDRCEIRIPNDFQNENYLTLNLFNSDGKLTQQFPIQTNQDKVILNLEEEASGIYLVVLSNGKKKYVGRVIRI